MQEELINSILKQIWCLEIQKKMTTGVDDMPDDILCNILSRLPIKPMVGHCRCVSKRWNALISDPDFMMSRSPLIFLESCSDGRFTEDIPIPINPTYILDESRESVTHDLDDSIFNLPPPEYGKMTGVDDIPDDILCNILSRLPVKPMVGRCRCVSKRWNALISDPYFIMSRSPLIYLESWGDNEYTTEIPIPINPTYILDESRESVTVDLYDSIFNLPPPEYDCDHQNRRSVKIVGTFSGIILLVVTDYTEFYPSYHVRMNPHIILYNPATSVYDILDDDPNPPLYRYYHGDDNAYGFGYGATVDELKIVRCRKYQSNTWNTCDVLNLKTRSWSHPQVLITQYAIFEDVIGTFLKGYLYWIINEEKIRKSCHSKIVAFDVDKMVFSEMHLPDPAINNKYNHLGTCHGCLWMITNTAVHTLNLDVWVLNIDQGVDNYSWSKTCSLTIGLEGQDRLYFHKIIEITDEGRIIIYVDMDDYPDIIIYDTSKHSYKLLGVDLEDPRPPKRGIVYKESLVSPMNICRACLI